MKNDVLTLDQMARVVALEAAAKVLGPAKSGMFGGPAAGVTARLVELADYVLVGPPREDPPAGAPREPWFVSPATYRTSGFASTVYTGGPVPWSNHEPEPVDEDPAMLSRHDAAWVGTTKSAAAAADYMDALQEENPGVDLDAPESDPGVPAALALGGGDTLIGSAVHINGGEWSFRDAEVDV